MAKPTILTVDDDPAVSQAVTRDLRERYAADYQIVRAASGAEALDVLDELARRDQPVALIVSDHRMPEMTGIEFLERLAGNPRPTPSWCCSPPTPTPTRPSRAINDIGLDHYLMKPWAPPEERLYPVLDDLLARLATTATRPARRRAAGRRPPLVGAAATRPGLFLARNHVPYQWLELERDPEARRLLDLARAPRPTSSRSCSLPDGTRCGRPRLLDLADALGLRTSAECPLYDLVIVGAGPAGLAAAVYGARRRGCSTAVDRAGGSRRAGRAELRIENYLGFPKRL